MPFPTVAFVAFFAIVMTGSWSLARWPTARKFWLVAAGGYFYSRWDRRLVVLLAAYVVVAWLVGRLLSLTSERRQRAVLLTTGIVLDLGALGVFKYYGFFVDAATGALTRIGLHLQPPLLDVVLPVGISFYCFQAISYLIEVHRGRIAAATLLDTACWLSFFPTLASGPITRASEFLPQLATPPNPATIDTARAYWLITRGLFKKLVVASFLATAITDKTFANPSAYGALTLLVGVYAYAAQIYCDFGGYTDMALGIACLLGFRLPENFDRPYTATSVQDFWSRWHMTLSRWLRDYLFAPLTMRGRQQPVRVFASIVLVMLLAGLWHGAAWGFVVFGGVHGVAMAVERASRQRRRRLHRPLPAPTPRRQFVRRLVTFHIVCLGWVFFASPSLATAGDLLARIATHWSISASLVTPLLVATVAGVIAMQYLPKQPLARLAALAGRARPAVQALAFAVASVPVLALAPSTVPAFIYYRF